MSKYGLSKEMFCEPMATHASCGGVLNFEFAYEEYVPLGPKGLDGYDLSHWRIKCDRCGAEGMDEDFEGQIA